MPGIDDIYEFLQNLLRSIGAEVTSPWFYFQIGMILAGAGIAHLAALWVRSKVDVTSVAMGWLAPFRMMMRVLIGNAAIAAFAILMMVARIVMVASTWPSRSYLLAIAAKLAVAWLLIRLATSLIRNETAVRLVSLSAWFVAALSIVGLLDQTVAALDSVELMVGGLRLTPLLAIKVSVLLALALWLANVAGNIIDAWIATLHDLTPSVRVLISKLARILLISFAVVVVLAAAGVDLSALAIFSGAVGVGIGFGLQKIVGNFVSGVILLADKSVKPGDLVTIGDSHGQVRAMNTRYISVSANDGREFLIPNEKLVTERVVNWTYYDTNTRVDVAFATSYDANPRRVCEIAIEIAKATPRVAKVKPPSCSIVEFADQAMKFSLSFWITDPDKGIGNVRSQVMLGLWDAFKIEGSDSSYPIRDMRIDDAPPAAPDSAIEAHLR
ncbi:mechanosensitive ion channel protein MscS [Afipia sp. P52-10]|jgi:small-conductance mechanosensitive channel|uniref:mechanosensitive ion channel family protein n=1 Tax=Afipia sp. P52-10 TaxID=1429916 RepID=UPI0003DF1B78|nr:mechanosensitive ion channel domain-containing protein [Afipia sp. P52-10]ETR78208.1 mechanosensitive ion channel protein MscS [Afipia sp. P52-10]